MSDQLEVALSRTLSEAAEAAPAQPPGLVDEVEGRFRVRRRRRYAAVAGVAAFAVIGGSAFAAGALTGNGTPPGPSVVGVPAAAPGEEPPVAEVWPEAYHKLSAKLADGRKYRVVDMIDDHRLLVSTEASFENANELWILDLRTSKANRLVRLPAPHAGHDTYASHFTVGSGHIVWWDSYTEDGKPYTRIWKAGLPSGEVRVISRPTLVTTVTGHYGTTSTMGDQLAVDGDTVYFSSWEKGGVRKVSLEGGKATTVPDTDGYHIMYWPWLGKPGGRKSTEVEDASKIRMLTELRNAETGEERDADVAGMENVVCDLTYCLGSVDGHMVARTRGGSETVRLPGDGGFGLFKRPMVDRFTLVDSGPGPDLFDIKTGRYADLGVRPAPDGSITVPGGGSPNSRSMVWSTDGNKTYHLLDLAAIK